MSYVYKTGEIEQIEAQYQAGATLEALALKYTKSVASIRMKLVKRGTYVKQTKPSTAKTTSTVPAKPRATTKAEVLAANTRAMQLVGPAPF